MDPHNYARRLELTTKRIKSSDLSERNKELIVKFRDECSLHLSISRNMHYMQCLQKLAEWLGKDFIRATIKMKPVVEINPNIKGYLIK